LRWAEAVEDGKYRSGERRERAMPAAQHPARLNDESQATAQTRATVSVFLDALVTGDHVGDFLAEEVTQTMMETGEVTSGRGAVARLTEHLYREAFAASLEVRGLVVEGRRAVVEANFVGTHVGEFAGIAPTGRTVDVPLVAACDVLDGEVAALRIYLSLDTLVRQVRAA
jgi:predicted ester cyclase